MRSFHVSSKLSPRCRLSTRAVLFLIRTSLCELKPLVFLSFIVLSLVRIWSVASRHIQHTWGKMYCTVMPPSATMPPSSIFFSKEGELRASNFGVSEPEKSCQVQSWLYHPKELPSPRPNCLSMWVFTLWNRLPLTVKDSISIHLFLSNSFSACLS